MTKGATEPFYYMINDKVLLEKVVDATNKSLKAIKYFFCCIVAFTVCMSILAGTLS